jgi:hypothetical protein
MELKQITNESVNQQGEKKRTSRTIKSHWSHVGFFGLTASVAAGVCVDADRVPVPLTVWLAACGARRAVAVAPPARCEILFLIAWINALHVIVVFCFVSVIGVFQELVFDCVLYLVLYFIL